ncbi:MAG: [protein-PII] uridylyltransferase [Deltaproteobacteria bacterium]|nr:[protein-PII] uridylyltransferase [Deltaproteobacteria bacterium]
MSTNTGFSFARRYTDLMDRFLFSLVPPAAEGGLPPEIADEPFALVALGSYGRRELCLGSDVDLMVIHEDTLSPQTERFVARLLYPLWDARLEVGHSVLTIPECLALARKDFRVLTSLMDGRFLLGSRDFYRFFDEAFQEVLDRERDAFIREFLLYREKREKKYGDQGYFVEPDIKEGLGGLRDLHFMAWLARICFHFKRLHQIKRFPEFSHFALERLHHSEDLLLRVRNHLHLLAGDRREDRLMLPFQRVVSSVLGYRDRSFTTGPDRFMRNIYRHLNRIRYGYEEFRSKTLEMIEPHPLEPSSGGLPRGFWVTRGNIVLKGESILKKNPILILEVFEEANRRGLFLGSEVIWEASKKIAMDGRRLLSMHRARRLFLDIVLHPRNPKILRLALEVGLIRLFIPEFKKIRNLAQFGYYHVETVDLHSLRILEVIQDISKGDYDDRWPLFREIFEDLKHPEWLYLAGLLHDIGKGYRGDHATRGEDVIPRILRRLGFGGRAREIIPFLVRHHLLLVHISQRRDLNDEKTSVQVAQVLQHLDRLKMLFLLTVADSISTGPMAHNEWKISLLIELYFKVRHILARGRLASPDATKRLEIRKKNLYKHLKGQFLKRDILDLMEMVSTRYFLNNQPDHMVEHFRMALGMGKERLRWSLKKMKSAPVTRVILCTHDRPGLFSKMVGVFTLNNIDVLSANIFTLKNGLAFDVYEVTNPVDPYREEAMWEKIREDAVQAIEDVLPLDERIQKKHKAMLLQRRYFSYQRQDVKVDNRSSDFFTLIEVNAPDRFAQIYALAKKFFFLGLDIKFAKVTSDRDRMTGVFYIRDSSGQKLDSGAASEEVRQEIVRVIEAPYGTV